MYVYYLFFADFGVRNRAMGRQFLPPPGTTGTNATNGVNGKKQLKPQQQPVVVDVMEKKKDKKKKKKGSKRRKVDAETKVGSASASLFFFRGRL